MLAAICVGALLVGTIGAMALTQDLRKEGPIASEIRFKEKRAGGYRVCFRMPRDDAVEVAMVASGSGEVVKVLADYEPLSGGPYDSDGDGETDDGNAHCFTWDGTSASGAPVGEGFYRLRLTLREADRGGTSGEQLRVAR